MVLEDAARHPIWRSGDGATARRSSRPAMGETAVERFVEAFH
jgi:hypothetical protein